MTNEDIKKFYHGAYRFEETDDGYLLGCQFTKEQTEYFIKNEKPGDYFYSRSYLSTAKTLEFISEATEMSLEYKLKFHCEETIDICIDGLVTESYKGTDIDKCGELKLRFCEGIKNIVTYLPAYDVMYIKNLRLNADAKPVYKPTKVLWMGDSITQGYGAFMSSETYVSVANRILNYEVLNQGVGGYYFDKNILTKMDGYTPDKIIIAHGTNQCLRENRYIELKEYFEVLSKIYKNIPTLVITPVWRNKFETTSSDGTSEFNYAKEKSEKFIDFCKQIKTEAEKYPNIKVLDGFKLLHHDKIYFMDDHLHPNALGSEVLGRNIADAIIKMGF